jgi:hypothetical protein
MPTIDVHIRQILFNSAQSFLNQLVRSIHYEYKSHGIYCLSVHYEDLPNYSEGQTTEEDSEKVEASSISPRDILTQSLKMFGKRAEVVVIS